MPTFDPRNVSLGLANKAFVPLEGGRTVEFGMLSKFFALFIAVCLSLWCCRVNPESGGC